MCLAGELFFEVESGEIAETLAFQIDEPRFRDSMDHMGRALYFHRFKIKWRGSMEVYPDFLLSIRPGSDGITEKQLAIEKMTEVADFLFKDTEYHGANPEVFKYQVIDGPGDFRKSMRFHFYGGARVMLLLKDDKLMPESKAML